MVLTRAQKRLADLGELNVEMSIKKTRKSPPKRSPKRSPQKKRRAKKATTKAQRRAIRIEQQRKRDEKKTRHLKKKSSSRGHLSKYLSGVKERRFKRTQKARETKYHFDGLTKEKSDKKRSRHLKKKSTKGSKLSKYFTGVKERRFKRTQKAREAKYPLTRISEVDPLDALTKNLSLSKIAKSSSSKKSSDELAGMLNRMQLDRRL